MTITTLTLSGSGSADLWHLTATSGSGSDNTASSCWTVTLEHQAVRLWRAENPTAPRFPTDPELEPYRERVVRNA